MNEIVLSVPAWIVWPVLALVLGLNTWSAALNIRALLRDRRARREG